MMRKRGALGEQAMGLGYLFLLVFLGAGIAAGVILFYGKDLDNRESEANQLVFKIKECLIENEINWEGAGESKNVFYEKCGLNGKAMDEHFLVGVIKNKKEVFHLKDVEACKFKGGKENIYFPKCDKILFAKGEEKYEVTAGIIQQIRRKVG